jgi:hypothetical protein
MLNIEGINGLIGRVLNTNLGRRWVISEVGEVDGNKYGIICHSDSGHNMTCYVKFTLMRECKEVGVYILYNDGIYPTKREVNILQLSSMNSFIAVLRRQLSM